MNTGMERIVALAGLGEAILDAVKDSGLLRKRPGRKRKAKDGDAPKRKPGRPRKAAAQEVAEEEEED